MPQKPASTLRDIDGLPRQLLALRSYLRAGDLDARWSWTEAEIAAYEQSPAHEEALAALAWAQARFAERNPGFSLYVNTRVRSLDTQVERWNTNASVGVAAEAMAQAAPGACASSPAKFADWARGWRPDPPANLAAPGLSAHGQGRAFDFQVMQGDVLVAGTDSRRIDADWIHGGWARRLAEVMAESPAFEGPLRSPREPWHYAYAADEPAAPAGTAAGDSGTDAPSDAADAD
ncbi:hypothetical protein FKV25_02975 [Lysobacter aestuarii]|uniref:Peptidase M15B domain-containing protein n=1 Tax=Marilutibacter aestuarii TaxID=1706195 RepID=A0A508ANC2_9GAMM|nr:hypothetical protein FKV25_02975 [Lysobacter aestuarii]